jgi:comEA protein
MSNRAYITALLLLVLAVSIGVLALRWAVVARRVPLADAVSHKDYTPATPAGEPGGEAARASASDWRSADEGDGTALGNDITAKTSETAQGSKSAAAGEAQTPTGKTEKAASLAGVKIDINSASATQLTALPGIGKVLAQRIVDYRTQHGRFKRVEDLLKVSGIGEKKLAKIKGYVYVQ